MGCFIILMTREEVKRIKLHKNGFVPFHDFHNNQEIKKITLKKIGK